MCREFDKSFAELQFRTETEPNSILDPFVPRILMRLHDVYAINRSAFDFEIPKFEEFHARFETRFQYFFQYYIALLGVYSTRLRKKEKNRKLKRRVVFPCQRYNNFHTKWHLFSIRVTYLHFIAGKPATKVPFFLSRENFSLIIPTRVYQTRMLYAKSNYT